MTLAQARDAAFDNRRLARAGGVADPMAAKRKAVPTLEQADAKVFEIYGPNWRNAAVRRSGWHRLGDTCFPESAGRELIV